MKAVIVIPARYKSTRFPGKPLTKINGVPMILRVANICATALSIENVYIATDDARIAQTVSDSGYKYIMTDEKALTGTDRIAEAVKNLDAEIFINVQGDEPLVMPEDILKILRAKINNFDYVIKGYSEIIAEDVFSVNIPKVVMTKEELMVYMSRMPIPGSKIENNKISYKKAVCIYAFNRKELESFASYGKKSELEEIEDIEILRFLDLGIGVKMVALNGGSISVDIPEDVHKVELKLNESLLKK